MEVQVLGFKGYSKNSRFTRRLFEFSIWGFREHKFTFYLVKKSVYLRLF